MTTLAGTYELGQELAKGGMGTICLARDLTTDETVVIKRLHEHLADEPEVVALFADEARLMPHLVHPNIVRVLAVLRKPGALALVLEHVPGANLRALVRLAQAQKALPPPALVAAIIARAARGLGAAHDAKDKATGEPLNVVHRDVSPDNILVSRTGEVKISDFGVARAEARVSKTAPGTLRGKMRFLSPEQLLDEPVDKRTDVWAMGATLFEALAGRPAFPQDNLGALLSAVIHGEPPKLREARPDVPEAIADIVAHCLERDVSKRLPSCTVLADVLDREVQHLSPGLGGVDIAAWVKALVPEALMDFAPAPGDELALDPSGHLLPRGGALRSESPVPAAPATPEHDDAPLELARPVRVARPALDAPEPERIAEPSGRARPRWLVPVAVAGAVALIGLGAVRFKVSGDLRRERDRLAAEAEALAAQTKAQLEAAAAALAPDAGPPVRAVSHGTALPLHVYVDSEPPGATVTLDGEVLGETPVGTTVAIEHPVSLVLTRKGFAPAEVPLVPGVDHIETVTLQRAAKRAH